MSSWGLLVCLWLVAIPAVPAQTGELAQKSQHAHEMMAAGKFEQAISLYRELIQAAPKDPGLKLEAWRAALKLAPDDPEIETQLAFALNEAGDYTAAQTILQPLRERHPGSAMINYLLGDTLFKLQRPAQAISYLEKAVAQNPHLLTAQSSLARAYVQIGAPAKAIPHLKADLPTDEDGSLHYQLARAYAATGQPQLGQEILKQYQEIQRAQAAEREAVEKEIPITAPGN